MAVPLIGAGIGIAAPAIANGLGIGKNDTRAKTFNETGAYDPHAFQYGRREGAADEDANYFRGQAVDAQNRAAPQVGLVDPNYGRANAWEAQQGLDRNYQNDTAHMMLARAKGLVPSIASQQAAIDMQRATAAQSSAAASARGAAGLALAGQNAANNTATMQSQISNNAQINAAQERLAAEQSAYSAFTGVRAGDMLSQQNAANQAQWNADFAARQAQFNAQQQSQRNAQNDAYSLGMYGQGQNVREMQMRGGMGQQQMLNNSTMNATNQNVAISQNNANREYSYYKDAMGAFGGGLSGATQAGATQQAAPTPGGGGPPPLEQYRANGGPVSPGQPYVVGERGPELIVPRQAGMVYPAEHPASRMAIGSDDRMKMGMSPLGLLGVFGPGGSGSNMNPTSGPAASSYEVLSGGGENVAASGQAMNANAMRFQSDPTSYGDGPGAHGGMMNQGLLSDDRAKMAAYKEGRADMIDDMLAPMAGEEPSFIANKSTPVRAAYLNFMPPTGKLIGGVSEIQGALKSNKADQQAALDESRRAWFGNGGFEEPAQESAPSATRSPSVDPVTEQFATGLAPIRFQYKPGMGPGGNQTGVRAQGAASQPITASMVQQRPDGLLQIDPNMGLSTALAGVGHLAQKQQDNEARLNGLLAMSARKEGY